MKRYTIFTDARPSRWTVPEENERGTWVRYDDVQKLENRIDFLEREIQQIRESALRLLESEKQLFSND